MKKRLCAMFLLVASCFVIFANASGIVPLWDNIQRLYTALDIDNNTAYCDLIVTGQSGTSRIEADIVLQMQNSRGSYTNQHAWPTQVVYDTYFTFTDTVSNLTTGNKYRLKVTVTVYNANGVPETETVYSNVRTCD